MDSSSLKNIVFLQYGAEQECSGYIFGPCVIEVCRSMMEVWTIDRVFARIEVLSGRLPEGFWIGWHHP